MSVNSVYWHKLPLSEIFSFILNMEANCNGYFQWTLVVSWHKESIQVVFFVIHNYPEKLLPKYSVIGLRLAAKQDQLCVQVFSHIEGHGLIINCFFLCRKFNWNLKLNQNCTVTIIIYWRFSQNLSQIISSNLIVIISNEQEKLIKPNRFRLTIQRAIISIKTRISPGLHNFLRKYSLYRGICTKQCSVTHVPPFY